MRINFSEVQRNVSEIANRQQYTINVLYELMAAYGRSASSITKLRNGVNNLAADKNTTVLQRGVVYFKVIQNTGSLPAQVEKLEQDPLTQRYNPRFLIATDLKNFAAKDTKKGNTLEIDWTNIDRNVDFFYGWTGDEVTSEKTEAVADRRAADKMKELYQEVEKVNASKFKKTGKDFRHNLNVFFTRLLFCFFAEDTGVFAKEERGVFTSAIRDYTQIDGSDLDQFLGTLFESLDEEDKSIFTSPFSKFPYVNGRLFDKTYGIEIPKFNAQSRHLILECGALSWAQINPDIFGSMFQSIVDEEHRATHGMHYTSVPNIMKTIEPLFLDELRDEFDKYYDDPKKLQKLHERISKIKIFDPACGSGNFLIIAYKELRKLEHAIIERLFEDEYIANQLKNKLQSSIDLNNFYGIEIDDFACEVAVLSLYLTKHQMNLEFEKQFGREIKLIPLVDKANVIHGNATRLDWQEVCPNVPTKKSMITELQGQLIVTEENTNHLLMENEWDEIYLISNPPYLGQPNQEDSHKADMDFVFGGLQGKFKKLDYVGCWFFKGTEYISNTKAKLAFISTNSIFQGVQVEQLWPKLFSHNIEIQFAFSPFRWTNNARDNAGVYVTVVSLRVRGKSDKYLFIDGIKLKARNINAYLIDADNIIVGKTKHSISSLHPVLGGCQPREGGHLMLSDKEKHELLKRSPEANRFIKPMIGTNELIKGTRKWCIWIEDSELDEAFKIKEIKERVNSVRAHRISGNSVERTFANVPHRFVTIKRPMAHQIVIPNLTPIDKPYLPLGYLNREYIVNKQAYCIFDSGLEYFALLISKTHMKWLEVVCGRLGNAISYSAHIGYNTFPVKNMDESEVNKLRASAREILFTRQNHSEMSLGELYSTTTMPDDLREAHHQNDLLVDKLYRQKPYANDEERLTDLFKLYEEMITKEK